MVLGDDGNMRSSGARCTQIPHCSMVRVTEITEGTFKTLPEPFQQLARLIWLLLIMRDFRFSRQRIRRWLSSEMFRSVVS
jgi:hypothetical protein